MKLSPLGLAVLIFMENTKPVEYADVARFEQAVESLVGLPLTQHQFDALVLFAYNVGSGAKGLAGSSLLRYLNADGATDAALQFMVWDKIRELENEAVERRRAVEKALFLS